MIHLRRRTHQNFAPGSTVGKTSFDKAGLEGMTYVFPKGPGLNIFSALRHAVRRLRDVSELNERLALASTSSVPCLHEANCLSEQAHLKCIKSQGREWHRAMLQRNRNQSVSRRMFIFPITFQHGPRAWVPNRTPKLQSCRAQGQLGTMTVIVNEWYNSLLNLLIYRFIINRYN